MFPGNLIQGGWCFKCELPLFVHKHHFDRLGFIQTQIVPQCPFFDVVGCNWTPYNNSNTLGGVQQSGLNSQMACQLGCYNAANGACKGYEWVPNNSPGSQCYFFPTNAPPTNMGTAQGVNHYTWDCSSEY